MTTTYLPRGSALSIEAKDLLNSGTTLIWNKVTEHNRSEISISPNRIEKIDVMSNGTTRKNFIATKYKIGMSWSKVPAYRTMTLDGAWGAEDLRSFYDSTAGHQVFNIRLNLAKTGSDQSSSGYESYTVTVSNFDISVVQRGLQPLYNITLEMDQV